MQGMRPVVEIMYQDFLTLSMEQLVNQAAKHRTMSGGQLKVPLTIRTQGGAGWSPGAQHAQQLESWFVHVPGLKVVFPSTPEDVRGLLWSSIYDDNPVIFFEHRLLYPLKGRCPTRSSRSRSARRASMRQGTDVTVIAIGRMVPEALQAAEEAEKEGISVEVVDPRTLLPLDEETIFDSVRKTTRCVTAHEAVTRGGFGAELAAVVQQGAFDYLDAPIERVGAKFAPLAFAPAMEQWVVPHAADVLEAVKRTVARSVAMATEVKLPRLGQGMESGTIVKWLKGEGEAVKKREPLYELDTDKVTQEVEAEADGVLLKIVVDSGEVEVGKTIALIGSEGEEVPSENGKGAATEQKSPSRRRGRRRGRGRGGARGGGLAGAGDGRRARARPAGRRRDRRGRDAGRRRRAGDGPDGRVKASPLARRLARERGIDIAQVRGTGPEGRIVAEDVEQARPPLRPPAGGAGRRAGPAPAEVEELELTSTRKTIARRLTEAWQAPVFQLTVSADMTRALELRERLVDRLQEGETKPTVSDLLTKVCAAALVRHRAVNAHFTGDRILRFPVAHVGIAVAAPNGLVVPVDPGRRPAHDPGDRRRPRRPRRPRPRRQAEARGSRGRHVHDLEPRHVRRSSSSSPSSTRRRRRSSRSARPSRRPSSGTARSRCGRC